MTTYFFRNLNLQETPSRKIPKTFWIFNPSAPKALLFTFYLRFSSFSVIGIFFNLKNNKLFTETFHFIHPLTVINNIKQVVMSSVSCCYCSENNLKILVTIPRNPIFQTNDYVPNFCIKFILLVFNYKRFLDVRPCTATLVP